MIKQASAASAAQKLQTWRDHLARQANSGKTVAEFCRNEGLTEGGFYSWRKRLAATKDMVQTRSQPPAATSFIDLGVVKANAKNDQAPHVAASTPSALASAIEVRIDLGGGIVLTFARR
jgi:hypothetical protein